ncbi:MAG: hypothetical protein LBD06_03420, partial [Candidatus Accumulibacter sp.]|nr:hypothetical protein [Accumulibacter sp.]
MSLRRCRAGGDGKTGRSGSASGWASKATWGVGDDGNRPVGGQIALRLDDSGHITPPLSNRPVTRPAKLAVFQSLTLLCWESRRQRPEKKEDRETNRSVFCPHSGAKRRV